MFLRDENGPFSARGYSGHTNGKDKDVGRALDLVISWYWDKNDNVMADDVRMDSYLRLILSGFFPGKAFDAGGDDREVNRASVEWAVTF